MVIKGQLLAKVNGGPETTLIKKINELLQLTQTTLNHINEIEINRLQSNQMDDVRKNHKNDDCLRFSVAIKIYL